MSILAICPTCGGRYSAPEQAAGRAFKCRKCGGAVAVAPGSKEPVVPGSENRKGDLAQKETLMRSAVKFGPQAATGITAGVVLFCVLAGTRILLSGGSDNRTVESERSGPPIDSISAKTGDVSPRKESMDAAGVPEVLVAWDGPESLPETPQASATLIFGDHSFDSTGSSESAAHPPAPTPLPSDVQATTPEEPNPFAALAGAIELPPVDAPHISAVDIGPLAVTGEFLKDWQVEIDAAAAVCPGGLPYEIARRADGVPDSCGWEVYRRRGSNGPVAAAGSAREVIGRFAVERNQFRFHWADAGARESGEQLRNCILLLSDGRHEHAIRLREPKIREPITLDLNGGAQHIPLDLPALPRTDAMYLELMHLAGFPQSIEVEANKTKLRPGEPIRVPHRETITVHFRDIEETALEVHFTGTEEKPKVTVAVRYRMGRNRPVLNGRDLDKDINGTANDLSKARAEWCWLMQAPSFALRRSKSAYAAHLAMGIPTDPRWGVPWKRKANDLKVEYQRRNQKALLLQKEIPAFDAALARLQRLKALGEALHERAEVHLRVCAATPWGGTDLLVARP